MRAYRPCLTINDSSAGALMLAGCHPAIPGDDVCTIDAAGGGKLSAKADPSGDVAIKVKLQGIGGCADDTLQAVASLRVTTDDCTSGDALGCTLIDLTDFPITGMNGSCVIKNGKCQIKTSVNTELGDGSLTAGANTSIAIRGAALTCVTNVNGGAPGKVAEAGLVIP